MELWGSILKVDTKAVPTFFESNSVTPSAGLVVLFSALLWNLYPYALLKGR